MTKFLIIFKKFIQLIHVRYVKLEFFTVFFLINFFLNKFERVLSLKRHSRELKISPQGKM